MEGGLSSINLFLNLSTHPTPLRRKGGPFQGKGFIASQVFLAYEFMFCYTTNNVMWNLDGVFETSHASYFLEGEDEKRNPPS